MINLDNRAPCFREFSETDDLVTHEFNIGISAKYIQWKPVKVTPLKVNNRFTSTARVGPVFSALYFSNLNPDNVNHLRP